MTEKHPITPPPELVEQWRTQPEFAELGLTSVVSMTQSRLRDIATQSAQWGANQELEACCEWLTARDLGSQSVAPCLLRSARRPKPPTLKEQALALINSNKPYLDDAAMDTIRRALEALDD